MPHRTNDTGRASWTGTLRVGLVAFPVQAFNTLLPETDIHLHQMHAACDRRIHYQKVCPTHGEIGNNEIVLAYEYGRNKYVPLEPADLEQLRNGVDRALTIEAFLPPDAIDPLYLDGRNYYLAPQKAEAEEPYGVLYRAMIDKRRWAIGQVLFFEREQLVLLRPLDNVFVMSMLHYHDEIRNADALKVAIPSANDKTVKLAEQLIEEVGESRFDFAAHHDPYQAKLKRLVEAKLEGKEIAPPAEEEEAPEVINLADALRKSIARSHGNGRKPTPRSPGHTTRRRRHA